jgi:cytochrome bd-type quinol oxidase subunit 2
MMNDGKTIRALYRKLLTLYPQEFRGRLGEPMERTFNDLYNEKKQSRRGMLGFVLLTFADATLGITKEHVLQTTKGEAMNNVTANLRSSALISLLFVVPFMIMEAVNKRNLEAIFNVPLFGTIWLLPMIFLVVLTPIVRNIRAGNSLMAKPVSLIVSVAFLILIATMWTTLVIDQTPCFLGVPNCD